MLPYFAFTLFVSAALLFFVQPLVGKMILPRLGGTPAVWNTCMVFFQGVLLVGYAYTHTLSTWKDRRKQFLVQLCILVLPLVVLPFSLGNWTPPTESNPVLHVLWLLLGLVGLPFFVVSTSAPLLQRWFGFTGHPAAKDPYFLYGASNLGSMIGLLAYPILIEPVFDVPTQAALWTGAYVVFALLVAGCVALVWKEAPSVVQADAPTIEPPAQAPVPAETAITAKRVATRRPAAARTGAGDAPIAITPTVRPDQLTWLRRLRWVGLAAAPSSLMLGLTTYMTTDIAAVPFFWVVPLALYLLTFILVFARWPVTWTDVPHTIVLYAQPCLLLMLILTDVAHLELPWHPWLLFAFHVGSFFLTTLMCHGELAKDRPPSQYLTEYYLWMSFGGVLGGMFNALFAPIFFTRGVLEYALAVILACICRPTMVTEFTLVPGDTDAEERTLLGTILDFAMPIALGFFTYLALRYGLPMSRRSFVLFFPVLLVLTLAMRPLRFGLALGAMLLAVWMMDQREQRYVFQGRGFFGFVKVRKEYDSNTEDNYHVLIHGGIDHGRQHLSPAHRRLPISYFHPTGGIGQIFQQMTWSDARLPASLFGQAFAPGPLPAGLLCGIHSEPSYAVVGLGTGTLACHARPGQTMHIYEIDPLVRSLSLPPEGGGTPIFTYVHDAEKRKADIKIIMGDGRLRIREAPEKFYHAIVLDAFSSDAIPVHLLTADAVEEYLTKLADGGVLIFNTTNRYVDIRGVLANIADKHDLLPLTYGDYDEGIPDKFGSDWVVLQRRLPAGERLTGFRPLPELLNMEKWKEPDRDPRPVWTDGYSNLLSVIYWGTGAETVLLIVGGVLFMFTFGLLIGAAILVASVKLCNRMSGGDEPVPSLGTGMGFAFLVNIASGIVAMVTHFGISRFAPETFGAYVTLPLSMTAGLFIAAGMLTPLLPTRFGKALAIGLVYWMLSSVIFGGLGLLTRVVFS